MALAKSRLEILKEQYFLSAQVDTSTTNRRPIRVSVIDIEYVARVQNYLLGFFPDRKQPTFAAHGPIPNGNTRFAIGGEGPLQQIRAALHEVPASPGSFVPKDEFCFRLTVRIHLTLSDGERVYQEFDGVPGMNLDERKLNLVIQPYHEKPPEKLRINYLYSLEVAEAVTVKEGDIVGYETPWVVDGENLCCLSKGREFSPFEFTWVLPKRGLDRHPAFFSEEVLEQYWPGFRGSVDGKFDDEIPLASGVEKVSPGTRLQRAAKAAATAAELEVMQKYLETAPKKERGGEQPPIYAFVRTKAGIMNGVHFLNNEVPKRTDFKRLPLKFHTTIAERWTLGLAIAVGLFYERLPVLSASTMRKLREFEKEVEAEKVPPSGDPTQAAADIPADLKEEESRTPLEMLLRRNQEIRLVWRGLRYVRSFEFGGNAQTFIYHLENPQHEIKGHFVENIGKGAAYFCPELYDAQMLCLGERAGGYSRLRARKIKGVFFFVHDDGFNARVETFLDLYGIEPEKVKKPAKKSGKTPSKKTA